MLQLSLNLPVYVLLSSLYKFSRPGVKLLRILFTFFTYSSIRLILLLNMSFGKSSNWLLCKYLSAKDDS